MGIGLGHRPVGLDRGPTRFGKPGPLGKPDPIWSFEQLRPPGPQPR